MAAPHPSPPEPAVPAPPRRLAGLHDIRDGGSLGLAVDGPGGPVEIFLVRHGRRVHGYVNSCPHTGVGLEWLPHRFLDGEGRHIQCATHGARFRIHDGYCVAGPCAGQSLRPCAIRVTGDAVYLTADPPPPF